jgi:hypothetical protein
VEPLWRKAGRLLRSRRGAAIVRSAWVIASLFASLLVASVLPSAAHANLSLHRASQAIKRKVHHFKFGYEAGSGTFYCGKHSPNRVTCDILFNDADGDTWCGGGAAARRDGRLRVRLNVGMQGCGSFKRSVTAAAAIHECGDIARSGAGNYNVTSRVVSCRYARQFVRSAPGRCYRRCRYHGFRCRVVRSAYEFVDIRCVRGRAVVRWQSGA